MDSGIDDRIFIADRLLEGWSIRRIASELNRAPSTISREVRRNALATSGAYRPHAADARAAVRRPRPKPSKIMSNAFLLEYIDGKLRERWSPEQISEMLRMAHPHDPSMRVCAETIYQAIYRGGRLERTLHKSLRRRRMRRRKRQVGERTPRFRDPMLMIKERPSEIEARDKVGHWEGDLVVSGLGSASALATLVERKTGYTILVHLPAGRSSADVTLAVADAFMQLPEAARKTLTWDQGSELAMHSYITSATGMPVYFCEPAKPWQRGTNENTNGLIRHYFPKGTNFSKVAQEEIERVEGELNTRPRKRLDWRTPAEVFYSEVTGKPLMRRLLAPPLDADPRQLSTAEWSSLIGL